MALRRAAVGVITIMNIYWIYSPDTKKQTAEPLMRFEKNNLTWISSKLIRFSLG